MSKRILRVIPRRSLGTAVVVGLACTGGAPPERTDSFAVGVELVLRDTATYENMVGGGTLAVLHVSGVYVDSVDVSFGVTAIGRDSLVFLPVQGVALDGGEQGADITHHVLATGETRRQLEGWLPYFNSYFSSPVPRARMLYYWGLRRIPAGDGQYDLYAMRYAFGTDRLDSLSLGRVELYTDNRYHLAPPAPTDSGIVFVGDSATYVVSGDFRTVRRNRR